MIKRINAEDPYSAHGRNYEPYLKTHRVRSIGMSSRVEGWKTGRTHQLLSKLERQYFYVFEWAPDVIDHREQYALPLEETQDIADAQGIRHPWDNKKSAPWRMTTDFLLTLRGGAECAICVKYENDLSQTRVAEKLEIERLYWEKNKIPWKIATERNIPTDLIENVEWIHKARDLKFDPYDLKGAAEMLENLLAEGNALREATSKTDEALRQDTGFSHNIVRHLLATRYWITDMTKRINPAKPLEIKRDGTAYQHAA